MYSAHPSKELVLHFARRPFQGVAPASAKFLFVGLDANYDENIENSSLFTKILEYHKDSITFWHENGVHHPFLLPQYTGDGRRYHRNFARIGFTTQHAELVSFVELLHVPTVGRNSLTLEDLSYFHLKMINSAIFEGQAQHIFVSAGVLRLMRSSGAFPWLPGRVELPGILPVIYRREHRTVYLHLHFSNYGKFQQKLDAEAAAISTLVSSSG